MYVNAKMIPVETVSGMGEGRWKRTVERMSSSWYIWYILRTSVNTPMYPHPAQ
jgi:hypothetical protein